MNTFERNMDESMILDKVTPQDMDIQLACFRTPPKCQKSYAEIELPIDIMSGQDGIFACELNCVNVNIAQ
ncbi:MAG: hypothetical protein EZS28_022194 [Streblomastix strix]|uniref:Uncharacterized protein n=1 Tax=Streblomastix strix TaxID=222440 RepID=A0A5J4VI11_9EUKA|nr:MAG: hypothetical protein EZS28_022194 [Streblomastix strix]